MNRRAIACWPLVEINAENQGAASASRTGGCAANISGEDHLKGMNPVDIRVDRFPRAPQSTCPEGRAIPLRRSAVSTSIKLQFRDACVDEARRQFIIRSISPLGRTHAIQSVLGLPSCVACHGWMLGHTACSFFFFFRDLTVTGAEWGPLGIQECGGGTACAPSCHLIFWVAEDALGLDEGVAVLVWG